MKKLKLLLPVVLILVLSFVFCVHAEGDNAMTVYLDQTAGADTNDGLSEATAVQTFDAAYTLLSGKLSDSGTGTIVLVSDYTHTLATAKSQLADVDAHSYNVIIRGKTADTALLFHQTKQGYIATLGPTTFENLCIRLADTATNIYLSLHGNGGYLKIGENVSTGDVVNKRLSLSNAYHETITDEQTLYLEVNSGIWRNIYAAGYMGTHSGSAELVMNGGSCAKLGSVFNNIFNGNVTVTLNGGTVPDFYPDAVNTGTLTGDLTANFVGVYPDAFTAKGTHTGKTNYNFTMDVTPDYLSLPAGKHSFCNLNGGALVLDAGASVTVTGNVTGTTAISFSGTAAGGVTYVTAPDTVADDAFTFNGCDVTVASANGLKTWTSAGEPEDTAFKGLVLTVDNSAYTVLLYTGLSGTTAVTPTETVTEDGLVKYYFKDLAAGVYRSKVSRTGYYTITRVVNITNAQATQETVMDVSTPVRAFSGSTDLKYQPTALSQFSDGMMNTLVSDETAVWWEKYAALLNTPVFTVERAAHQATTQEEMEAYIAGLDTADDNMYVYSLGKSGTYGMDIPVVIFTGTDLSGAQTLEEAAALINANNKLTVHYQGQIHGNEPAAGEAALAVIGRLDTAYGDGLLETINIYVIPRLNPDGSYDYTRRVPTGENANRDMLLVQTQEVAAHHYAYKLFMPEVSIDSHEYTVDLKNEQTGYKDMMIASGHNGNSGGDFGVYSEKIARLPFDALNANGMEVSYYVNETNGKYAAGGTAYRGMRGAISLLMESRGIGFGNFTMERRVTAHLIAVETVLDYVAENAEEVQAVSDAERQRIAESGKTYEESDTVVIAHKKVSDSTLQHTNIKYNYLTGEVLGTITTTPKTYVADTTRSRPTAYVIPAGQSWTEDVLTIMDHHDISYYFVEAGTAISLQQYTGTVTAATLTQEQTVVFGSGAYVLPMNQQGATVLALLMEPDLSDEYGVDTGNGTAENCGTLAQMEIIPADGESFPIYRYIHDLNEEGKVDTTTVEYKVYVNSAAGADSNDAYSEETAAQTIEHAFAQLDSLMESAPEGASGTVVFLDLYTVGSNSTAYTFPSHEYPVVLTSKTGSEGITKGGTATQYRWIGFGGDTTLDNITIKPASTSKFFYVFANGHKLTVKETVNTLPGTTEAGNYFNISAGKYSGSFTGNGELTVLGGTWQHLYMGGYVSSLTGDVNIIVKNATFTGIVQSAYNATTTGNINIYLENTSFGVDGAFYAGNANKNSVVGDVTLTLGQNVNIPVIYAGSRDAGNVTGTMTVIVDGADLTGTKLIGKAKNDTGTVGQSVLVLKNGKVDSVSDFASICVDTSAGGQVYTASQLAVNDMVGGGSIAGYLQLADNITTENLRVTDTLWLDMKGKNLSGLVIDGTLYALDSTTNQYSDAQVGKLTCTGTPVADWKTTGDVRRYIAICGEDGSYTFHRIYVGITRVSLNTAATGFGYKAVFYADDTVKALFASQGYSLWLTEDQVASCTKDSYSETLTLLLKNYDVENFGETKVNAKVYLSLNNGVMLESQLIAYSMQDMAEYIDADLSRYTTEKILAVKTLLETYATTEDWEISNLRAWTQEA